MAKKTRNGYIDLLRFVAACVIMYFHFGSAPFIRLDGTPGSFPSGALFVEFFFMLSGYYAISSFQRSHGSLNELGVPFIMNRPLNEAYKIKSACEIIRNRNIFEYLINGTD